MSVLDTDLWPNDLLAEEAVTPLDIIRKQASLVGSKTNHLIEGEIDSIPFGQTSLINVELLVSQALAPRSMGFSASNYIVHRFTLVSPAMGGYRYTLFSVITSLALYPVVITWRDEHIRCNNEADLLTTLAQILQSESTRQTIQSMISHSKA
ncbi:MAG: hypothetical protein NT023_11615 [Armatimonadetes bacterium]|nr:hypothetical protein [Armatimonadota bacterium]